MYRIIYLLLVLSSLFNCTHLSAQEINVTGFWHGSWEYSDKSYTEEIKFNLAQQNNIISGTGIDQHGVKATVSGSIYQNGVDIVVTPKDNTTPITFRGKVNGDIIKGTWYVKNSSGPWHVTR